MARSTRRSVMRLLWRLIVIGLAILLLPYLLVPFYRFGSPVSTLMLWRWATGARVERTWTPLDAMAQALPFSVIASEDARFCQHRGVDWEGLSRAIEEADDASDVRGGSTITQQVAKNLFLWQGRSYVRKALELPLALWVDFVLPKHRVLEIYLNIAEWGPNGEFGAEAATRHAFGKGARSLGPREAALLAAILPNPIRRSAGRPGPGVRRLAGLYEGRARAASQTAECIQSRLRP